MSWDVGGFIAGLDLIGQKVSAEAEEAVIDIAEYVLSEAIQEVPHEDGDLQASGKVSVERSQNLAAVSFDTPYAVVQHEDLTMKHDAGRKAKYLEGPLTRVATSGTAKRIIEQRLKGR